MGMKNGRGGWDSAASNGPKWLFVALISSLCLYVFNTEVKPMARGQYAGRYVSPLRWCRRGASYGF